MDRTQFHVTFRIAIVGAIIGIVVIMSTLTCLIVYARENADAKANAALLFDEKSTRVQDRFDRQLIALTRFADLGASLSGLGTPVSEYGLNHPTLGFLFRVLETEPSVYGAYAGWSNGDFLMLINAAGNADVLRATQAPPGCRYIVRAISGNGENRAQRWCFLDGSRAIMSRRVERRPDYDPRTRDWFRLASVNGETHLGRAYRFNSLNALGVTASRSFDGGVFGVDMTLTGMKEILAEESPSQRGGFILLEEGARLLTASDQAFALLPPDVTILDVIADSTLVAGTGNWADSRGRAWLRHRTDWNVDGGPGYSLIVMAPYGDFTFFFDSIRLTLFILGATVLSIVTPIALWVSSQLSRPLATIAHDAERVGAMDFGGRLADTSWIVEIAQLSAGYSRMKEAVNANRTLVEAQRDSFARFVPRGMLELLGKTDIVEVGPRDSESLDLTVMFSDIRSYTSISERLSCHDVFELLNDYFEITNPIIGSNDGIIDKYIGDAIMSLFPTSPDAALRSLLAINEALREFNGVRAKRGEPSIQIGTGIHYGTVDLGTVGDRSRMQATVIGDAVNLASRLESATKTFGVRALISDAARAHLENPGSFRLRLIDTVRVKGKDTPIGLYEAFDLDEGAVSDKKAKTTERFSRGIQAYKEGNFETALELFADCASECPQDSVAMAYVKRCATLIRIPPGDGWAGVSTL